MNKAFEKILERLEEDARFYNSASDVDQNIRSGVIIAKEIVQETAAEYEECYKDCGECEAYNKEKHHCPKFCKVIKETVKEIEENHNDWIPCSERLPKYEEVVMCYCTNSGITISCITHKGVKPSKSVRFGQHSVIAWQPLPHPYQPKG